MGVFAYQTSIEAVIILLIMAVLNLLFYHLLKAPTRLGRRIMDQLEGFKQYLSKAEAHRLRILHPAENTPELFEKYLPYALALDVEHAWRERFSDVQAVAGKDGQVYSPAWYSGSSFRDLGTSGFASNVGAAFSGAIPSSATAPGSRSGSGASKNIFRSSIPRIMMSFNRRLSQLVWACETIPLPQIYSLSILPFCQRPGLHSPCQVPWFLMPVPRSDQNSRWASWIFDAILKDLDSPKFF